MGTGKNADLAETAPSTWLFSESKDLACARHSEDPWVHNKGSVPLARWGLQRLLYGFTLSSHALDHVPSAAPTFPLLWRILQAENHTGSSSMQGCLTHVCPVLQMVFPLVLNNKFSLFKNLNKDNIEITKKKKNHC